MNQTTMMGIFGGVLVALAVFLTDTGIGFDTGELSSSIALVQLVAGLGIVMFLLVKQHAWAMYMTIAATTVVVIALIDVFRSEGPGLTLGFVVALAGVVLALIAVVGGGRGRRRSTA
jgi:hypothetical protein